MPKQLSLTKPSARDATWMKSRAKLAVWWGIVLCDCFAGCLQIHQIGCKKKMLNL